LDVHFEMSGSIYIFKYAISIQRVIES